MKILYDHQAFTFQDFGGVSRYFVELFKIFKNQSDVEIQLPLLLSNNSYIRDFNPKQPTFFPNFAVKGRNFLKEKLNKLFFAYKLQSTKADILHPTFYNPTYSVINKIPYIFTVHDLIEENLPQLFPKKNKAVIQKQKALSEAAHLIAISENTKNDLLKFYNIDEKKITVIHHGITLNQSLIASEKLNLPNEFLLFLGNRYEYKNFLPVVKALKSTFSERKNLHLVCVGGKKFTPQELAVFQELGISKQLIQLTLSDNQLAYCYQKAIAFIFPSLYEGFGMPILEAFTNACPLLLSSTSCFPEIAAQAAQYFDPYDDDSIKLSVEKVLNSEALRKDLIAKGKERVLFFSWKKAAQKTLLCYQKVIDETY